MLAVLKGSLSHNRQTAFRNIPGDRVVNMEFLRKGREVLGLGLVIAGQVEGAVLFLLVQHPIGDLQSGRDALVTALFHPPFLYRHSKSAFAPRSGIETGSSLPRPGGGAKGINRELIPID